MSDKLIRFISIKNETIELIETPKYITCTISKDQRETTLQFFHKFAANKFVNERLLWTCRE